MNSKNPEFSNNLSNLMDIDKDIHEPARLMILSYLFVIESADFVFLQGQTDLTWGNLSSHISKLEEKQYVKVEKEFIRKKPRTMVKITEKGKKALLNYREKMKKILE